MLNLLALKFKNPYLLMNFSKIKIAEQASKPIVPGLRSPPMMKKPTLNQNERIAPKNPNLINKIVKKEAIGKEQVVSKQSEFMPVIKKKHAVVTIMGHVDHGKTTLIDHLRKSDIAEKEDGGITQRISAFRINCLGERITFIDTPGHEAFTNMRQRGASVTDIVVLVVSATEGVKKQTLEVIQLLKKWQVPVIVAINKIDLPEANPEEVEQELTKAGLDLQTHGGQIPVIHISAKTGLNVELLCELIIQETKNGVALFNGMAEAFVLEAMQTKQKLNAMTVVMRKGTLRINSSIIVGHQACKVRSILDDRGASLTEALPGEAVQIVGIPFIPAPGDLVLEMQNLDRAKHAVSQAKAQQDVKKQAENKSIDQVKIKFARGRQGRRQKRAFYKGIREVWMIKFAQTQEKLLTQLQELKKKQGNSIIDAAILQIQEKIQNHKQYVAEYFKKQGDNPQVLNFILKFGDRGMEETILMQLQALKPALEEEVKIKLNLISCDVGSVSVTDIQQAQTFNARIFTFGADISGEAKRYITDNENIRTPRTHKLIHNLLKDLKDVAYEKKLATIKGNEKARCEVAELFVLKSKNLTIPGIKVTMGKITRTTKVYVFRNAIPISSPLDISFLKSFKKEMVELKKGQEGTIGFVQDFSFLQKGDQLRFYQQN